MQNWTTAAARLLGLTGKDGQAGAGPGFNLNDNPFQQRQSVYDRVRTAVLASARGMPGDLTQRVQALMGSTDIAATAAVAGALGLLRMDEHRQPSDPAIIPRAGMAEQWAATAARSIAAKKQMAANALAGVDAEAASIVSAALLSAAPSQPMSCDDFDIGERRADMRAILGAAGTGTKANQAARDMLTTALADGDDLTVYVLTSASSGAFLKALGVDIDGLRRTYALAKSGVSTAAGFDPYRIENKWVPSLAFIVAQSTPGASLADLITAARTCSDLGLAEIEAQLAGGRL